MLESSGARANLGRRGSSSPVVSWARTFLEQESWEAATPRAGTPGEAKKTRNSISEAGAKSRLSGVILPSCMNQFGSRLKGTVFKPRFAVFPGTPHRRLSVQAYVQSASKAAGVNPRVADWIVLPRVSAPSRSYR